MPNRALISSLLCTTLVFNLVLASWAQNSADDAFKFARNLYRDARDYATSAELFAEFISNYPNSEHMPEARLMLARSYGKGGRCDLAINAYQNFFQEHPKHLNSAAARMEQAECLSTLGSFMEAARAYEDIQTRFSASEFAVQVMIDAAVNYTHAEDLEQAMRAYRKVISEYRTHNQVHEARFSLAKLYFAIGKPEQAQEILAQISAADSMPGIAPSALLLAGRIDLFLGSHDQARKKFANLHQRFGATAQSDSAYLDQATFFYERHQFKQAGNAFQTANRYIDDTNLKSRARLGLANSRLRTGQPKQAIYHYKAVLQELPFGHVYRPQAQLGLAVAIGQTGQFEQAVKHFHDLIQANSSHPETITALRELGSLYERRKDITPAIAWYNRYLQKADSNSDRDPVILSLARLYVKIGYFHEAISAFRDLAERSSALAATGRFNLAQALEESAQPRLALREYMKFLEQFPSHPQAHAARERIEYLRDFTVIDLNDLNRSIHQVWINKLSGISPHQTQMELAQVLYDHHDFANAALAFEAYTAANHDRLFRYIAQYYLAESRLKLARQRQLEGLPGKTDSLRQLALQDFRILAAGDFGEWTQRAQIRLVETEAMLAPDSLQQQFLEKGFADFIEKHAGTDSPHLDWALLHLASARRHLGQSDSTQLGSAIKTYRQVDHESPLYVEALFALGLCHASNGEHQAAVDSLSRVLRDYPSFSHADQVLYELGQLLLRQGRPQAAIARYQELLWSHPAFPQRPSVQMRIADIQFQLGKYAIAIELYRQLADEGDGRKTGGYIRWRLAQAYHRNGEYSVALEMYNRILAESSRGAALDSVFFAQAELLVEMDRPEIAISQFLRVRDDFTSSPLASKAAQRAGHLLFELERFDKAYQTYQPLLPQSTDAQVHGQSNIALFRLQRLKEARKAVATFSRRFPEDSNWAQRFRLEEGQYHLGKGGYKKSLKIFRQVEERGGGWADDGAYFSALTLWEQNLASPSEKSGVHALEAQSLFIKSYPNSPFSAAVHLRLANYHYGLRNYLVAAGAYKRVLEKDATAELKHEAIWKLLDSYARVFEFEEAHQVALRLLREFPHHPKTRETQLRLGIILKDKGQYAQAIVQLEKTLEWARGNDASEARFYIAESYQNMGEYRKAIEAYYRVSFHGAEGFSQWISSADFKRAQCHEALQEYTTAISVYERIVRREGTNSPQSQIAKERISILRQRI